jgi:hypothetical protein
VRREEGLKRKDEAALPFLACIGAMNRIPLTRTSAALSSVLADGHHGEREIEFGAV